MDNAINPVFLHIPFDTETAIMNYQSALGPVVPTRAATGSHPLGGTRVRAGRRGPDTWAAGQWLRFMVVAVIVKLNYLRIMEVQGLRLMILELIFRRSYNL